MGEATVQNSGPVLFPPARSTADMSYQFRHASPVGQLMLVIPLTEEVMILTVPMATLWTIFSSKLL